MAKIKFYKGTTVPTTSNLSDGSLYFNTSNNNIYLNNGGTIVTYKGTDTNTDTNTTYSAGTGISLSGTKFSNAGVRSISTGTTNGTISVNTNGSTANVAVKGLGSAAYRSSDSFVSVSSTSDYDHTDDFSDLGPNGEVIHFLSENDNNYPFMIRGFAKIHDSTSIDLYNIYSLESEELSVDNVVRINTSSSTSGDNLVIGSTNSNYSYASEMRASGFYNSSNHGTLKFNYSYMGNPWTAVDIGEHGITLRCNPSSSAGADGPEAINLYAGPSNSTGDMLYCSSGIRAQGAIYRENSEVLYLAGRTTTAGGVFSLLRLNISSNIRATAVCSTPTSSVPCWTSCTCNGTNIIVGKVTTSGITWYKVSSLSSAPNTTVTVKSTAIYNIGGL